MLAVMWLSRSHANDARDRAVAKCGNRSLVGDASFSDGLMANFSDESRTNDQFSRRRYEKEL